MTTTTTTTEAARLRVAYKAVRKKPVTRAVWNEYLGIVRELEALPVSWEGINHENYPHGALYWYLSQSKNCWRPAYNAEVNEATGWATLGIRYADGAVDTIACQPGQWAHCSIDESVNIAEAWD